jgi:hypothetical protein
MLFCSSGAQLGSGSFRDQGSHPQPIYGNYLGEHHKDLANTIAADKRVAVRVEARTLSPDFLGSSHR